MKAIRINALCHPIEGGVVMGVRMFARKAEIEEGDC